MTYFVSIAALVAVFAVATFRPINMGILAFVAAFSVGLTVSDLSVEEVADLFPGDFFIVVFGITLFFGIAIANGTVDHVLDGALLLLRGRPWAVVWLMFFVAAGLMALGSVLAVAMLAPIAMPLAKRYAIDPLLMGMMISHGALAAAFSPITVYAVGLDQIVASIGIDVSKLTLFAVPFALNLVFAAVLFAIRGRSLMRSDAVAAESSAPAVAPGPGAAAVGLSKNSVSETGLQKSKGRWTLEQGATVAGILALLIAALCEWDVGVTSIVLAAVLLLVFPARVESAMQRVAWQAILLVCGLVTYMGVITTNGTLEWLGEKATSLPSPLLTAFLVLLVVGLISAVGSSFGIMLIALPLIAPLLAQGEIGAAGFVIALAFCATVVDVSPFSTNGVIVLASALVDDRRRFQRKMLGYTGIVVAAAPLAAWLVVILPTSV